MEARLAKEQESARARTANGVQRKAPRLGGGVRAAPKLRRWTAAGRPAGSDKLERLVHGYILIKTVAAKQPDPHIESTDGQLHPSSLSAGRAKPFLATMQMAVLSACSKRLFFSRQKQPNSQTFRFDPRIIRTSRQSHF